MLTTLLARVAAAGGGVTTGYGSGAYGAGPYGDGPEPPPPPPPPPVFIPVEYTVFVERVEHRITIGPTSKWLVQLAVSIDPDA